MKFDKWYDNIMDRIEEKYGITCLRDDSHFKDKVRRGPRTMEFLLRRMFLHFLASDISCEIYDEYIDLLFDKPEGYFCVDDLAGRVITEMIDDYELDRDIQRGKDMISFFRIWKRDDPVYMQRLMNFMANFMWYFEIYMYSLHSRHLPFTLSWHTVFSFIGCNKEEVKKSRFFKKLLAVLKRAVKNSVVYLYEDDGAKMMTYIKGDDTTNKILSSIILEQSFYDLDTMEHPCASCKHVSECVAGKNVYCKRMGLIPIVPDKKGIVPEFLIKWRYK